MERDPDTRVDRKPAVLAGEHVGGGRSDKQASEPEPADHAATHPLCERGQIGRRDRPDRQQRRRSVTRRCCSSRLHVADGFYAAGDSGIAALDADARLAVPAADRLQPGIRLAASPRPLGLIAKRRRLRLRAAVPNALCQSVLRQSSRQRADVLADIAAHLGS